MNRLSELMKRPGVRYIMVGGSVYVLELIVILVALRLGATAVEAVALSFLIGLIVSFLLQKLFTFGDKRMHHKIIVPQMIAVTLLVLFNLGFTVLVTKLLQNALPAVVTRTLVSVRLPYGISIYTGHGYSTEIKAMKRYLWTRDGGKHIEEKADKS
jgi:putative flippase GtrA